MEGSDNKRVLKCVKGRVYWLRQDGLDTTHLKKNSWNCEILVEAIKGTQLRWHSKAFILKNFAGDPTTLNGIPHGKVQLLRPKLHVWLGQVLASADCLWIKTKS